MYLLVCLFFEDKEISTLSNFDDLTHLTYKIKVLTKSPYRAWDFSSLLGVTNFELSIKIHLVLDMVGKAFNL